MQSVLRFALGLLFIVGTLSFAADLAVRGASGVSSEQLTILVGSRGHMLPSAAMDGGDEPFADAIALGDLLLTPGHSKPGLRVALLHPNLEFRHYQSFDTASGPLVADKITRMLNKMPRGTILVASVQGNVRPPEERRAELSDVARMLGAETSPFVAPAASWAIVSCKLDRGWRTLAESYSEQQEVHVAFTLSPPVSDYAGATSNVNYVQSDGPQELDLFLSCDSSSSQTSDLRQYRWKRLGGEAKRTILFRPKPSAPGRVTWQSLTLGSQPKFTVDFGMGGGYETGSTTAVARLRIQGEEVAQYEFKAGDLERWQPWSVDLSAWEGQTITLELETAIDGPKGSVELSLGMPALSWSREL